MTEQSKQGRSQSSRLQKDGAESMDGWPSGTGPEDRRCWVCGGLTSYRHCKIQCQRCGFMRDCSDP